MANGRLAGKIALVTGAGSGIGRAIALGYLREGARVAALDRNAAGLDATAAAAPGGGIETIVGDVTVESSVAAAVRQTVERLGRLDVLVNNAAIQLVGRDGRCHEVSLEAWDATMDVNLKGPFLCCKHALPELIKSRGCIVNLASPTASRDIGAGWTAYAASKGGISTLTRVVAADYARDGVRVNAIVPGPTQTPLTENIFSEERYRVATLAKTPLGRLGQAEDLVGVAIFLASDESRYATGAHFFVDGGMTMA